MRERKRKNLRWRKAEYWLKNISRCLAGSPTGCEVPNETTKGFHRCGHIVPAAESRSIGVVKHTALASRSTRYSRASQYTCFLRGFSGNARLKYGSSMP